MFTRAEYQERERDSFVEQVEEGSAPMQSFGRPMTHLDPNLLPFDLDQGRREIVPYGASASRSMEGAEAKGLLRKILQFANVDMKTEGIQLAFLDAMLLAHVKNGASQLTTERAIFYVGSGENRVEFNYFLQVVDVLGSDLRRFFRAYANYTKDMLDKWLKMKGSDSYEVRRHIDDIMWVAHDRGISREPSYCFDSADACSGLTPYLRNLIAVSKAAVLAKGVNNVDVQRVFRPAAIGSMAHENSGSPHDGGLGY
jgi:hypothetical protein